MIFEARRRPDLAVRVLCLPLEEEETRGRNRRLSETILATNVAAIATGAGLSS